MANYSIIARLRPEVQGYLSSQRYGFFGDVLAYRSQVEGETFSTDEFGFRHTRYAGETLSFADCVQRERYGLVLGASNIHGFGIPGNENALPSLLGERLGMPIVNASMPGGNSRNLHSLLVGCLAMAPKPPALVVHYNGGDLSTFCFASVVHPLFGSPNRQQVKARPASWAPPGTPPDVQANALHGFMALWTSSLVRLCKTRKIPVALGHTGTFFDKAEASSYEQEAQLGTPRDEAQERQFEYHRRFNPGFYSRRQVLAEQLGVPIVGVEVSRSIGYIDEFHPDAEGHRALSDDLATAVEPLLSAAR